MRKLNFFKDNEEKKKFISLANNSNYKRLKIFAPVMFLFMAFELIMDIYSVLSRNQDFFSFIFFGREKTFTNQKIFMTIEALVIFMTVLIRLFSHVYRKKIEKYCKPFFIEMHVYTMVLLFISVIGIITDVMTDGGLDMTFYFYILILIASVFYISPMAVLSGMVITNFLIWLPIAVYKIDSRFTPYKPYYVFIMITLALCSVLRFRYLLETLRSNKEITLLKEQAQKENLHKSMFLANMSHEIRTPMNAIVGMSEIAMDYNLKDEEKNTIRQIRSSGLALLNIINDILDFSKIESGKLEIIPVNYDLFKMIYDSVNVAKVKIAGKPIELIVEMDPSFSSIYYGDNLRINQILINLISNATKFTEKGFILVRVEKADYENQEGIKFSVIDTGCGIKEDDLSKLFNAFQQVDMKINRSKEGTGLGLSISKRLVHLMNGTMNVISEYGKGSCFYFQLPQISASTKTVGEEYKEIFDEAVFNSRHPELKNLPLESLLNRKEFSKLFLDKEDAKGYVYPKAKILVVDDNEVNLQVAEGLLKKFDVIPECALSGWEALKLLEENDYDIIYMDHQMPVMDGIETLKKIREKENDEKHTTIIALSANAVNGARENFLKSGFDDFVPKPVQQKDFARSLKKWLAANLREEKSEPALAEKIPAGFEIPDSEKINLEQAMDYAGGFEAWLMAAKVFAKGIDEKIHAMKESLSRTDYKNYTIQVHALKSAARVIGAAELSGKAEYLEVLGNRLQSMFENRESLLVELEEKHLEMEKLFLSYKEILKNLEAAETDNEEKTEAGEKEINALLEAIKAAASGNNLNEVEHLFGKLKRLSLTGELKEKLPELQDAIEDIEFEKILEILR